MERLTSGRTAELLTRDVVLVHGMSHGAWCWERLGPLLEARGHRVLALDLPGHGRRAHERHGASIEGYARAVVDAMALAGLHGATVVGHSMAGIVIPRVAVLARARVARLVFLAAVVPAEGEALAGAHLTPAARALVFGLASAGGGAIRYPAAVAHARWFGDVAPADPAAAAAHERLTPQPLRPWRERVDRRGFAALGVPCAYVRCLRDQAVPPGRALEYAARLGVVPADLDADHGPMLSCPERLAALLTTSP